MIEKLLLALNDCAWAYNLSKNRYVFISSNLPAVLGTVASEFPEKSLPNLIVAEDRDLVIGKIKTLQPGQMLELHYRIQVDNEIKWIFEKCTRFFENGDHITLSVLKDVSDEHAVKQNLDSALGNFSVLFDKNPNPMWIYESPTLRILKVNNAAVETYGYSKKEFLSMTIRDIRPKMDLAAFNDYIFRKGITKGKPAGSNTGGIWRHQDKHGDIIYAEITGHEIRYSNTTCRIIIATNVTERITWEMERKKADSLFSSEKEL